MGAADGTASPPEGTAIEVVRGIGDPALADELVAFWTGHGALDPDAARRRVEEVVCVLRGPSGEIAGVNSAYREQVQALGGRLLWVYRTFAPAEPARRAFEPMFAAAAEELGSEFTEGNSAPWGICTFGAGPPDLVDPCEVRWPVSGLMLAGFTGDGRQIRVRYFDDPTAPSEYPLRGEFEIVPLAATDAVDESDVIELWRREGAVDEAEAQRRVGEVCMVGLTPEGELAGLSTAYLARNERLRSPMWHVRVFVGSANRAGRLATHLNIETREHLISRFQSGEDRRAPGIVLEIEELMFERQFPWAVWPINEFTFIGVNPNGAHVRVYWFEGARIEAG